MLQGKRRQISIDFLLLLLLLPQISSTSIAFSYRTCLPNVDLLHIEHYHQPLNSQFFRIVTRNFRLHLIYTSPTEQLEFQFGYANLTLPSSASFDYQFQAALDYYHEIDTWHYVNVTFDDSLSKVFLSFNGDETRLIPLIDYPWKNASQQLHVKVLLDDQQSNVTCLLPHSGFEMPPGDCSLNIKTCESRTCTSTSSAEQYCPLFKIFDCRPFTDLECGLKTIPVRCQNNHCQNRGACYVDLLRNITLCVCPPGFAGDQCQYSINECQSNPCPKHSHCIDLPNSYTCVCDIGWTGGDCSEDIDECQTMQPCKAARTCINLPGTYKCDCFDNFGGQNCEMTLDPCLSQPCLNEAIQCHPILESDNVVFRCTCQSGFTGSRCETNINDCEGVICPTNHTHCVDGINSFDCQCQPTFKRNREGLCVEQNPCDSSPCQTNATCYNLKHGQYRCMCPSTYTGSRCESDIDECTVFPSICRNGGKCINEIGSYRCYCAAGWTGPTCVKAIDFCLSQPCNRNGTCLNQINGFECRCLSAYTGEICQYDIDECVINPCRNNGTCFNYVGGFHCQCPSGYFGHHCEYSPMECQRMHQASLAINCPDPSLCLINDTEKLRQLNQLSSNTCKTERGRLLDTYFTCINEQSPERCSCPSNILPCPSNQSQALDRSTSPCPCRNGGTCFWLNATNYRCYCPPGLTGTDCLTDIDLCASHPCYNNGTCLSQVNSFTCRCPPTYRSTYCDEYLDPCATNPCLNNGTCHRENDQYTCHCSSSLFTGKHCEIQQTPCMSQPCQNHGKCLDVNQTFECQCSFQHRGMFCEELLDLCQTTLNSSLCLNGGLCRISNHTIECSCLAGFTGLFCETNIDDCYTKPCSPNGECLDLINGYQCQCKPGWYGYNCDRQQKDLAKSLVNPPRSASAFHLRNSSLNISKSLLDRHGVLPIRIQYEFRTTLKQVSLLAIGDRFQQELINGRIVTNLDNKVMLSTFLDHQDDWISIVVEVFHLWIDVRIGKNAMSQRFYVPSPSLLHSIHPNIVFGYRNYSGCVRQIEVSYSPAYSILLTDQVVEINENRLLGCERTNACQQAVCRTNELCHDHWFYHTCQCQSPFFGAQCDQIAPILPFNQSSALDVTVIDQPITNISFFFNTIQSNGTLFELTFSRRTRREATPSNSSAPRIIGRLVNGRFRLLVIANEPPFQEYELRNDHLLNDGRPHRIELDLARNRLLIDSVYNESLTKLQGKLLPNQIHFLSDQSIDGWFQDIRINNQPIPLSNASASNRELRVNASNIHPLANNPCYPNNPCLNRGLCLVTQAQRSVCQCESNWFGANCSQINLCHYNNSTLCPTAFRCQTTGDQQECLAIGTFQGNSSQLRGTFIASSIDPELSLRFRAHAQSAHLLTVKNTVNGNAFSLSLSGNNILYRDSALNTDLLVYSNNDTSQTWNSFHLHWTNQSTIVINHAETFSVNLTFEEIFVEHQLMEIDIGNGFRGCLEDVLIGTTLYVPFYNETLVENDTRVNRIQIDQFDDVQINQCTFNDVCNEIRCVHGQCLDDFDRGRCSCDRGWEGSACEMNIDECQLGNNCSKEHSICQDQPDGYYTCQCHPGFTGKYCETNIDDCSSSPCANRGLCTDLINGYLCNCTKDYISANCSISLNETCLGRFNRCQHNGTCLLKSAHLYVDQPRTECQCRDGYNGSLCQNDLCSSLNCQHNGTCQRLPNGQAKCSCTEQWHGETCEDDVDECTSNTINPCLNNGTCINEAGGYSCQCREFYLGQHCERKHTCLEYTPCWNNGQCRAQEEHYYCECSTNFTGFSCELPTCESLPCENNGTCTPDSKHGFLCNCSETGYEDEKCTTEINECLSKPCQNNATCIDQIAGYSCSCPKSFFGNHCENKKFLAALGFSYHYVIWPGVAVLLLLVIILLSIVIGRIRESRRSRGTYRPALNENGQSSRVEFSMILKPPPEERLI